MRRLTTNSLLMVVLICATLWALVQSADLAATRPHAAGAPRAVSTVRAYYAAVRTFFETGSMSEIRAVVDPTLYASSAEGAAEENDLTLYLRGLRDTFPALTFSLEELTASNETVIARITIDYGPIADVPLAPMMLAPARQQIDTFRVVRGRIVGWSSTGAASGLVASAGGAVHTLDVRAPGALVVARISFAAGETGHVAIAAPALLIVERGSVRMNGNGLAVVSTIAQPEGQVAAPGSDITVRQDESILLPRGSVVLSAGSQQPVSLLAAVFVPEEIAPPDHEVHTPYLPLEQLLAHAVNGPIGRGVTIERLDRADDVTVGPVQLIAGVVLLAPGGGMAMQGDLESPLLLPRTGTIEMAWSGVAQHRVLVGEGDAAASAWFMAVRPVAPECVVGGSSRPRTSPVHPLAATC